MDLLNKKFEEYLDDKKKKIDSPCEKDSLTTNVKKLTGGDVDYYLIKVEHPKRLEPYTAEVEDLIEALSMEFGEGTLLKSLVRLCKLKQHQGKGGSTEIYEAQKIVYYANRILAKAKNASQ